MMGVVLDNDRETGDEGSSPIHRVVAVAGDVDATGTRSAGSSPSTRSTAACFAANEVDLIQPVASLIGTQRTNGKLLWRAERAPLRRDPCADLRRSTPRTRTPRAIPSGWRGSPSGSGEELEALAQPARGPLSDGPAPRRRQDRDRRQRSSRRMSPLTTEEYRMIQSHVEIGVHILDRPEEAPPSACQAWPIITSSTTAQATPAGWPASRSRCLGENPGRGRRLRRDVEHPPLSATPDPEGDRRDPPESSGVQWDPRVIDALFACRADVESIRQKGLGDSLQRAVNDAVGRS